MAKGNVMKRISIREQNQFNAEDEIFLAFRMIIMMKNKIVTNERPRNLARKVAFLICKLSVPGSSISRDPYVPSFSVDFLITSM